MLSTFVCSATSGTEVCQSENSSGASGSDTDSSCATLDTGSDCFGNSGSSTFLRVTLTERFAGFKMPGPIGPCSAPRGTKSLGLKYADVGDIVLLSRTIVVVDMVSGDWSGPATDLFD
jgi:hypothetical protein